VLTIWQPNYWANALAKAVTAALSLGTALIIWRIMPAALQAPSMNQLEQAKAELESLNAEIAEGVESISHANMLVSMGCKLAQGYGIARPMPAKKMLYWVNKWHSEGAWKA